MFSATESPTPQSRTQCPICLNSQLSDFTPMITHSLSGKYSSSQNFYYTKDIQQILGQSLSHTYIQFQQNNYIDDDQEYLRRQYLTEEFPKKVQMLSEYYKFHRNQPTWNDHGIEPIMVKYYNKLKDVDYKRIKNVLKQEQNISITTHQSFSSFQDSQFTKKSRYSTMLNELNTTQNQSVLLLDICDKIGRAFKKLKPEQFKGNYYSGEKKFEEYLKRQKKRKEAHKNDQIRKKDLGFKKFQFSHKLPTKDDETALREINYKSHHSVNRNMLKQKQISSEKTAANDTTNEEKSRRQKYMKNIGPKSSRGSLSKKNGRQHFMSQITPSYKQLATISLKSIANTKLNKQALTIKQERLTSKTPSNKLKYRSNSSHNLQTNKNPALGIENRLIQNKIDLKEDNKMKRTTSKKKIPVSTARTSVINLLENGNQLKLNERKTSQKMIRANSHQRFERKEPVQNLLTNDKKKSSKCLALQRTGQLSNRQKSKAIQGILEKKLEIFNKKQILL